MVNVSDWKSLDGGSSPPLRTLKINYLQNMKLLNEFIFEQEHIKGPHGIFEMTQISSQGELPKNS